MYVCVYVCTVVHVLMCTQYVCICVVPVQVLISCVVQSALPCWVRALSLSMSSQTLVPLPDRFQTSSRFQFPVSSGAQLQIVEMLITGVHNARGPYIIHVVPPHVPPTEQAHAFEDHRLPFVTFGSQQQVLARYWYGLPSLDYLHRHPLRSTTL
jgi:hypothetical protein